MILLNILIFAGAKFWRADLAKEQESFLRNQHR